MSFLGPFLLRFLMSPYFFPVALMFLIWVAWVMAWFFDLYRASMKAFFLSGAMMISFTIVSISLYSMLDLPTASGGVSKFGFPLRWLRWEDCAELCNWRVSYRYILGNTLFWTLIFLSMIQISILAFRGKR